MSGTRFLSVCLVLFPLMLTACQAQQTPSAISTVQPGDIAFSGDRALAIETDFVTRFPSRDSGQPNNRLAAEWLLARIGAMGWDCSIDEWDVVHYSRLIPLNNVVCRLPGASTREILVIAHIDQAPTTVQGADNDGSGIAILLQLAEIFAAESVHPYTLVFLASDAEDLGMLGTLRYVETHPSHDDILTAISLDNLGYSHYHDMDIELLGRFNGYSPIWLPLIAREAARAAGSEWQVNLKAPFDQVVDQAAPVSFMDQGPAVAAGIPAIGFAGHKPADALELHQELYHSPGDTLEHQSAASLGQSGLIAEALIRQLFGLQSFPRPTGPYLYFDDTGQVLQGIPLYAIFILFVALFFLGSFLALRDQGVTWAQKSSAWLAALPHFLGLWLPFVASLLLLYAMVGVGLMGRYERYPATTKHPDMLNPRWPAVIIFVLGLALFLYLGRLLVRRFAPAGSRPAPAQVRSWALLVIGLGALYILLINPFSLLFTLPVLFWLLIRGRHGLGRVLDLFLFLLGGLVVYALIYIFGFQILRYNFAFLWYMLNMFSSRMLSFPTACVIFAILGAGLSLVVTPPALAFAREKLVHPQPA